MSCYIFALQRCSNWSLAQGQTRWTCKTGKRVSTTCFDNLILQFPFLLNVISKTNTFFLLLHVVRAQDNLIFQDSDKNNSHFNELVFKTNSFEIYLCYGHRPLFWHANSLCLPKLKISVKISSQSSTKNVSTLNLNLKSILLLINH